MSKTKETRDLRLHVKTRLGETMQIDGRWITDSGEFRAHRKGAEPMIALLASSFVVRKFIAQGKLVEVDRGI